MWLSVKPAPLVIVQIFVENCQLIGGEIVNLKAFKRALLSLQNGIPFIDDDKITLMVPNQQMILIHLKALTLKILSYVPTHNRRISLLMINDDGYLLEKWAYIYISYSWFLLYRIYLEREEIVLVWEHGLYQRVLANLKLGPEEYVLFW